MNKKEIVKAKKYGKEFGIPLYNKEDLEAIVDIVDYGIPITINDYHKGQLTNLSIVIKALMILPEKERQTFFSVVPVFILIPNFFGMMLNQKLIIFLREIKDKQKYDGYGIGEYKQPIIILNFGMMEEY